MTEPPLHVAPGHMYSPLPSADDVERAVARAADVDSALPGIDLREAEQLTMLRRLAAGYPELTFAEKPGPQRFGYANTWFTYADAILLALMIRDRQPARIVEVGCGHSSAALLDSVDQFAHANVDVTFIEPNPERLQDVLRADDLTDRLIATHVQDAPMDVFAALGAGDFLLIDSSHVVKAGSDVQHLLDVVLPSLAPGVLIHVHDIFYPFEYPADWLRKGTALNEAYVLRALLQFSTAYRIELFTDYLLTKHAQTVGQLMPLALKRPFRTGGIWLSRT